MVSWILSILRNSRMSLFFSECWLLHLRIAGTLQNWKILCPPEKKDQLRFDMKEIKGVSKMTFCLPDVPRTGTWRSREIMCSWRRCRPGAVMMFLQAAALTGAPIWRSRHLKKALRVYCVGPVGTSFLLFHRQNFGLSSLSFVYPPLAGVRLGWI